MLNRTYRDLPDKDKYRKQLTLELRGRSRRQAQEREKAIEGRRLLESQGQLRIPGLDAHGGVA